MNDDWVPIQFPDNLEEMLEHWAASRHETVGWCFLCDGPIHTEADLIPRTNTHNCPAGRELEARHPRPVEQYWCEEQVADALSDQDWFDDLRWTPIEDDASKKAKKRI